MAKFNIQEAIEQSTQDGKLDSVKLMGLIDENYVNPIVAKNKPDKDKLIAENKSEWIKSLGFEGVENEAQLQSYVKGTSNEWKEKHDTLLSEYGTFKDGVKDYNDLKGQLGMYQNYDVLRGKGVTDQDQLEFLTFKIGKLEGETFADKLTAYETANPKAFASQPMTTGARRQNVITNDNKMDWERMLEEKHNLK